MKRITFHYDGTRIRHVHALNWLRKQVTCVDLAFENRRKNGLLEPGPCAKGDFYAVSDDGGLYCGEKAWLMCLWATYEYRLWAMKLAARGALRRAFELVNALATKRVGVSA